MFIYVIMPLLESQDDPFFSSNKYWLGQKYQRQISNRLSNQEKDDRYKAFAEQAQKEFYKTNFENFTYLEVIGNTDDHEELNKAKRKLGQKSTVENIIFKANTEPFETRNGNKLPWVFGSLGIGLLAYLVFLLFPKLKGEEEHHQFTSGDSSGISKL